MDWKQLLAYITGSVDQELLLRHEYLITENRILRRQIPGRVRLSDEERKTLAEIGAKLGKQALPVRRQEIRRLQAARGSRPPEDRPGAGGPGRTPRPGESCLGV